MRVLRVCWLLGDMYGLLLRGGEGLVLDLHLGKLRGLWTGLVGMRW